MLLILLLQMLFLLSSPVAQAMPSPTPTAKIYFVLYDAMKDQWCGYKDEKLWRADINNLGAYETASVEMVGQSPKVVKLTEADVPESGDWIVYDVYSLSDEGIVTALVRTTNVLSTDTSRREMFKLRGEKLVRTSQTVESLKSHHEITANKGWFPPVPIASKVTDLPFSALLTRPQRLETGGQQCVKGPSEPQNSSKE